MVSWGHWFALFNILLSLVMAAVTCLSPTGRQRLLVAFILRKHYRPFQLPGVRHLLADPFPLTFIVGSQRLMRFLSVILQRRE